MAGVGPSPGDPGSCGSSTVGLTPLSLSGDSRHPESWTLVHEWNMEKRQQREVDPYKNWKFDVQSQIANMGDQLRKSLQTHPVDDSSSSYSGFESDFKHRKDKIVKEQTSTLANSLAYGLGRT
ncbi:uncharacterized protein LOC144435753 [Glandiceps talaboti]